MPRYALRIAYDGSDFHGWWRQPQQRCVASHVDQAFARLQESAAQVLGAARTDAGVHAEGQVAHVDCARNWTCDELVHALNTHVDADVSCQAAAAVADDWHACHLSSGKTYRYEIDLAQSPDPLRARYAWRPPGKIKLEQLQEIVALIPGQRDWSAFARSADAREDFERTIYEMRCVQIDGTFGPRLQIHVRGAGFTYHLVRSLIGAAVAVVTGRCQRRDLLTALAAQASPAADFQAPAKGLCLQQVHYEVEPDWVQQH